MINEAREIEVEASREATWQILGAALNNAGIEVLREDTEALNYQVKIPELAGKSLLGLASGNFTFTLNRSFGTTTIRLVNKRGQQPVSPIAANVMERLADQVRFEKVRMEVNQSIIPTRDLAGSLNPTDTGNLELLLDIEGETLWRRIDFVADQVGFTILERIPEQGKFIIRFISTELEEAGDAKESKLAFWRRNRAAGGDNDTFSIEILPGRTNESISRLRVTDLSGQASRSGDEILELLRAQL